MASVGVDDAATSDHATIVFRVVGDGKTLWKSPGMKRGQAARTVDYVKPAALAAMTASGTLAGRPYLSMPATGIPQGYRADFGAATGGTRRR